jgi:hypothetical protein
MIDYLAKKWGQHHNPAKRRTSCSIAIFGWAGRVKIGALVRRSLLACLPSNDVVGGGEEDWLFFKGSPINFLIKNSAWRLSNCITLVNTRTYGYTKIS